MTVTVEAPVQDAARLRAARQRLARSLDTAQIAALVGVTRFRVQELARYRRDAEAVAADRLAGRRERAEARAYLRDRALPAALPGRRWRAGAIWRWAYDTGRVDELGRPQRAPAPGRSPGGPPAVPRHRQSLAELAGRYDAVVVDDGDAAVLAPVLQAAYARARREGLRVGPARAKAAQMVSAGVGWPLPVCEKVMLQVARAARAKTR